MKLNLKQIFDIAGERKEIDYAISGDVLDSVSGYTFASPVLVKGEVFNRTNIVRLKFTTEFTLKLVCDRCLKELEREYSYAFEHIIVRSLNTDNDEYIVAEDNCIDMDETALSDLLLQLPTKMLCSEDCKGLCEVCGCDLNESECDCFEE